MKTAEEILDQNIQKRYGFAINTALAAMYEYAAQETAALEAQNLALMEINKGLETKISELTKKITSPILKDLGCKHYNVTGDGFCGACGCIF